MKINDLQILESELHLISDKIKNLSNSKCLSIITTFENEQSGELFFSVNLITPKLGDYSYQLVRISSKNITNIFPVEIIHFAKASVNNQFLVAKNISDFKKQIDKIINSKITLLIVDHLVNLSDLKEEIKITNVNFQLSDINKTYTISQQNLKSPLVFKKIILTSHVDSKKHSEWINLLINTSIEFKCTYGNGASISQPLSLITLLSPNQLYPIFDTNFTFPTYSDMNIIEQYPNAEIAITLNTNGRKNFTLDLMYEIEEIENNIN